MINISSIILSFIAALSQAGVGAVGKKSMQKSDEYINALFLSIFSLPILIIAIFFWGLADINITFWVALAITTILNIIAWILFMRAIHLSDLSLVGPLISLTPCLIIIIEAIVIMELPTFFGIIGIILVVIGVYFLNAKENTKILDPIKALLKDVGARYMFIVSLLWAISSTYDRVAVINSNPWTFLIFTHGFRSLAFIFIIHLKSKHLIDDIKIQYRNGLPIGMLNGLGDLAQMTALQFTLASYVLAIKRTSALFLVIFGMIFFNESIRKNRWFGTFLIIFGAIIIALYG